MDAIEKEICYYKDNRKDFISLYANKYLVIKGMQIIGIYKSHTEAFEKTIREHEKGTFIIEHPMELKLKLN